MPLFLKAIMVGHGANAGSLSPFAPTGIIVNGLMMQIELPGHELTTYLSNAGAHALVAFGGYFIFGGLKLFTRRAGGTVAFDQIDMGSERFARSHWVTLGTIVVLLTSVIISKDLRANGSIGMAAFVASVFLVLTDCANDGEAVKRMPWRVILMVCGVTVLISIPGEGAGDRFAGLAGVSRVDGADRHRGRGTSWTSRRSPRSARRALPGVSGGALFNKLLVWGLSMSVVGAAISFLAFS